MALVDLATGSTFAGRYRILGRLASGGMGAVYEALHLETRRRRALKVMLPELFARPELRDRFRREAHVTSSVKSEHLVDVFDAGVDERGMPFLVMELLEGQDLGRVIDQSGPIPPSDVVTYLAQVASALDRTHAASIVHRDLKPENLFLTHRDDGSSCIKILDFGISKIMNEAATGGKNTTSIGTPAYMAPEQIVGGPVSPAADLHALGLIAYTLLTGRAYWQDDVESTDNALAFALRAAQGIREPAVARAARHGHALPPEFDAWFSRAVDLEPSRRFKTASEAVLGLAAALGLPPPELRGARPSAPQLAVRGDSGPAPARAETDHTASLHGVVPRSSRGGPKQLALWLAAGSALGLAGIAMAVFAERGSEAPPPAPATTDPTGAPTQPVQTVAPAPIVAPVATAAMPHAPAPLTASTPAPPAPRAPATPDIQRETRVAEHPKRVAPTVAPSAPPPEPAPSAVPAVAPGAATASFPAPSSRPRVKYTRD